MADESDPVIYQSTTGPGRGGPISATKVVSNTRANFFAHVPLAEAILGSQTYWGGYIKNDHPTDTLNNVVLFIDSNTISEDDEIEIALDNTLPTDKYTYSPSGTFNGTSDFVATTSTSALQLLQWSVSAWFKTSASGVEQTIVNKGGTGSDTGGENDNYSLVMNSSNQIQGGFEEADGTNHYATSASTYNDGLWHFAVVTYDQITIRVYIDGAEVATHATTTTPETNTKDLVIGRNSRASDNFFNGRIDEVRVWNNDLTAGEVLALYNSGTVPQIANIVHTNTFGANDGNIDYVMQTIANVNTAPTNVTFIPAPTFNQGLLIGKLIPTAKRGFWIHRNLSVTRDEVKNRAELIIAFDPPKGSTGTGSGSGSGTGGGPSPDPGPAPSDYAFAVAGDWGTSSDTEATVDNILNFDDIELTVGTGDYSYKDSGDEWADITKKLREDGRNMVGAFGNHDRKDGTPQPELTDFYLSLFGASNDGKAYYDFTYNNFYFIFIDQYSSQDVGSAQYNWVKDKMEKSRNNSAITWRALVAHEPIYTPNTKHGNNSTTRNAYHPLMVANNFDFYMNGHNHNYFRSYPINFNSGSPGNPTVVSQSQNPDFSSPGGMMELQSGAAGRDLYSLDNTPAWSAFQYDSDFGFLKISVSNSGRQVTGQFFKNDGSQEIEKWTLIK